MPSEDDVRTAVGEVLGSGGDPTVLDYICGCLEDFEFGDDAGEEAFDSFGAMMVDAGCVLDDDAARAACNQLVARLGAGAAPKVEAFRALAGGPMTVRGSKDVGVHPGDILKGRHLIQTPFSEFGSDAADPSVATERDFAKLRRREEKEEKAQRAAFAEYQAQAMQSVAGDEPVLVRNLGAGGSKDVHLEDFCVSNGGPNLIEDASLVFAHGRRYGLIGRNGTGKTTLLRALAGKHIKGIPPTMQILHVEQEVAGDSRSVLEAVLACDTERTALLKEEAELMAAAAALGDSPSEPSIGPSTSAQPDGSAAGTHGLPITASSTGRQQAAKPNGKDAGGKVVGKDRSDRTSVGSSNGGKSSVISVSTAALAVTAVVRSSATADGTASTAAAPSSANTDAAAAAAAARLTEVYKRLDEIDAYGAEARAASILAGLSFDAAAQQRATKTFSGGWRMRVALARALFIEPDLLLLDEPTNHLDLHAVLWLEDYLVKWPKTLLVVSHAREFLNAVTTDTIHLHSKKLTMYKGNYSVFEKTAAERLRNAKSKIEAQDAHRKHVQAFIDKFRFNAKRAAMVQSRIKALNRLEDLGNIEEDPQYQFKFPDPDPVAPPILGFNDVAFGYPGGPLLFHNLNFGIDMGSRFAMVGPNGIGKSTLLNLIGGVLEPTSGYIERNAKVRLATFSQHHVDGLDLALTPLQCMMRSFPNVKDELHRAHLGSFGIGGELCMQPMFTLSGGQKSRVALARVTWTKPHILLLDEPSNHLDIDAVQALIEGLALFQGGVLMVSHDQHLIESTVDELWAVENGTATPFHGTFEEYKARLRAKPAGKGPARM
mmetsp:Transcript_19452/g.58771  ORF Transcript_19452/g.58771 Transcript_19452/m.58771 type:complete len:828 (+) Transcript_19452:417-2900(+)|eukprot:CAMPEP_0206140222 /NCGR_PEP_ID=MMETSP1473-20131121/8700_1 /ASSEMBLY_ACC=CAM_ASM_001109 /TAXON_ID=1461547 /ORGANISM="Stichococcus sp, Strain RCC1054" /LENGTH=827 /DNA_ID=CAMNT_0053534295 /DNA_START=353 /DNA_END=2836 /DNA_ORIENTATION=+